MKMLTEDQVRELMGKSYMRGRADQAEYQHACLMHLHHEAQKILHQQMDAEAAQVELIIAGL